MHRFPSLGLKSRIDAAFGLFLRVSLHRFASLGLKSRIDARKRANPGHSLQRFPISAPELAITAAPDPFPWISLQPKGVRHGAAAEECRMGRDFGRRTRPWLREEGPAAQRWEGKHRRCAPVRSPCPQAESDAGTRLCPQADSDAETRPLPAGRLGRGKNGPCPQADSDAGTRSLPAGRLVRGNAPW